MNKKENPKHIQAQKEDKAPLEYLIRWVFDPVSRVLKAGAKKYGIRNWRVEEIKASTYEGSIQRHIDAWVEGQDIDPDSGQPHLAAVIANCIVVMDAEKEGMLIDDRDRKETKEVESDTINISWHIDDVKQQARDDGKTIYDEDAREILNLMDKNHDANIGINWEVISIWINYYLDGRLPKPIKTLLDYMPAPNLEKLK